jgi:hypothetical protein
LRPWIGGSDIAEPKYRKFQLDDSIMGGKGTWVLESVFIRGDWLENDFIVVLY